MQDDIPGVLKGSIGFTVDGTTLYVFALASYAEDVEFGHHVFHPTTKIVGPEFVPAQPFMRPALYKYRVTGI